MKFSDSLLLDSNVRGLILIMLIKAFSLPSLDVIVEFRERICDVFNSSALAFSEFISFRLVFLYKIRVFVGDNSL